MTTLRAAVAACLAIGALAPALADARDTVSRPWAGPQSDAATTTPQRTNAARSQFSSLVPPTISRNLPGALENFEVVSKYEASKVFGDVKPGQIADLAVHKGYAYLNYWDDDENTCARGGTEVVDINNPAEPKHVTFIPAKQPFYHGEGAHVVTLDTPKFKGDVLAVNDETYGPPCEPADKTGGGFDLYDVTNPRAPKTFVQGASDSHPTSPTDPTPKSNSYHSVFVWQDERNPATPDDNKAYLVASDNIELTDVDIFDITDPANPVQVGDYDLVELFPEILQDEEANGGLVLHHDMVVKRIEGRMVMLSDYWDAGYVQLDVTNPENPRLITDTTFNGKDPLSGAETPEGNAHQGEFSSDNQFLLAADEDFGPFRAVTRATSGPNPGTLIALEGSNSKPIATLPDGMLNGHTTYVGNACDPATIPDAPADDGDPNTEDIAVIERAGTAPDPTVACGFALKLTNVAAKGWDAGVIFNNANRPDGDQLVNMDTSNATIPAIFSLRASVLGTATEQGRLFQTSGATPAVPTAGADLQVAPEFDGWGYAHLYDAKTSERLDSFAIPEAMDPRYAAGFGDLSIHEFATDPTEPVAYSSYYAGGIRAFTFSRSGGLQETGKFIDDRGSNFWGIEQFTTPDGQRLIAGSDRDFGLVILKYTGPGAPQRPSCSNSTTNTGSGAAVRISLACTDANGNPLTRKIVSGPGNGSLSAISGDAVTYTPRSGFSGADSFRFVANDGAADSAAATATVNVAAAPSRPSNLFTVKLGKFSKGKVKVTVTTRAAGRMTGEVRAKVRGKKTSRLVRRTVTIRKAGAFSFTLKLSKSRAKSLRRAINRRKSRKLKGSVRLQWTPTGGTRRTANRSLTLRR
jgi:hypothetical protein